MTNRSTIRQGKTLAAPRRTRPGLTNLAWFSLMLIAFALNACNRPAAATPTGASIEDVYTAVAITLTSQADEIPLTATAPATPSPTLEASPTREAVATATPSTQAQEIIVNSFTNACDNSTYISDATIPDGTEMSAGETFTKTWLVQNTGSCTWSEAYALAFISGDEMDGTSTEMGAPVLPGEQAKVSVALVAPDTQGTYTGYWKLMNAEDQTFGTSIFVQIVVSADAATSTPTETPTATEEDTSTSTHTSTPEPTGTSAPTATPTAPPTDTEAPTATVEPSNTPEPSATPEGNSGATPGS